MQTFRDVEACSRDARTHNASEQSHGKSRTSAVVREIRPCVKEHLDVLQILSLACTLCEVFLERGGGGLRLLLLLLLLVNGSFCVAIAGTGSCEQAEEEAALRQGVRHRDCRGPEKCECPCLNLHLYHTHTTPAPSCPSHGSVQILIIANRSRPSTLRRL